MRYKIDSHDYQVRIGQAVRFLKAGDKVKCTVIFRGREIQHTALAEQLLMRMAKDLEDSCEIQQPPKREGRNMIMFLTPRKQATGGKTAPSSPRSGGAPQPAATGAGSSPAAATRSAAPAAAVQHESDSRAGRDAEGL